MKKGQAWGQMTHKWREGEEDEEGGGVEGEMNEAFTSAGDKNKTQEQQKALTAMVNRRRDRL